MTDHHAPTSSKRQNPSTQCIINDLPEHILLHILSFLPTKPAIATALLSKTWRHQWPLVPSLDLHNSSHNPNFKTFVNQALDRNKSPSLRRFRLETLTPVYHSDLDSWISSAMERSNLQDLEIDLIRIYNALGFGTNFVVRFPPIVMNTLVSLKLCSSHDYEQILIGGRFDHDHDHDGDVYFPSLKVLHLKRVGFESPKMSLSGFLIRSRFPLLEELVVRHTEVDHGEINVSFPALRCLEIRVRSPVKIECPALRSLALKHCIGRGFHIGKLHNLVEASFEDEDESHQEYFINLVYAVLNVRVLKLCLHTMMSATNEEHASERLNCEGVVQQCVWKAAFDIPNFHNLVEVDFTLDGSALCMAMIMLHKFENLQRLNFCVNTNPHSRDNKIEWTPPIHVPNCLSLRLATFCFREFKASEAETEIAKYILKNATVLKNAKFLFYNHCIKWKRDHCERELLATFRGSARCQLEFASDD